MDLISTPVTGEEPHDDTKVAMQALALFYSALNSRNIASMQRCWSSSGDASMDNPLGGIVRGWSEIESVYARLFNSDARFQFVFQDYTFHSFAECFLVVGRERGWLEKSGQRLDLTFRTSRFFRLEQGQWRLFHHHGSADDPRVLSAYQNLVSSKK